MPLDIPVPTEEILTWDDQTRTRFPRLVCAKLDELIEFVSDETTYVNQSGKRTIGYRHLLGSLESNNTYPLTSIEFWIASHDETLTLIHLPGSHVWLNPNNHTILLDPIDKTLLPDQVDYNTIWVVYNDTQGTGYVGIAEITLVPPEQVPSRTWHLGLNIH